MEGMKEKNLIQDRIGNRWTLPVWVAVVALLFFSCEEKNPKPYQVGILCGADFFLSVVDGFKAGMTDLGYIEGENIVYDVKSFNLDPVGGLHAVERFVADKLDLVFTVTTEPTVAAQAATRGTNIPVLFAYAGIEGCDLVESVRRPGKNITGVRYPGPDQISKRLEILLEFAPWAKRIWIGYEKNYPNSTPALEALRRVASSRGVTLVEIPASALWKIEADLSARTKSDDPGLDAILLMPDNFNHSPAGWALIKAFAAELRVPIGGSFLYTVEQGALFGNANDLFKVGELAAPLAQKLLNGTPGDTIPVVTPEQDLWVNYKVAQELGLTVPEGLLSMAAKIIRE
jgi:putative tryptophan/tyrosine transport system substrate-binding protein